MISWVQFCVGSILRLPLYIINWLKRMLSQQHKFSHCSTLILFTYCCTFLRLRNTRRMCYRAEEIAYPIKYNFEGVITFLFPTQGKHFKIYVHHFQPFCIHVCVCLCVYVFVCVCVYVFVYGCVFVYVFVSVWKFVCFEFKWVLFCWRVNCVCVFANSCWI